MKLCERLSSRKDESDDIDFGTSVRRLLLFEGMISWIGEQAGSIRPGEMSVPQGEYAQMLRRGIAEAWWDGVQVHVAEILTYQ